MKQLKINHPLFKATILKQGAQLIHFQPTDKEPFLWSAELDTYASGVPFRGGIPICWPWFGKAYAPSHGFARIVPWKLESRADSDDGVTLRWVLRESESTRAFWDYPFVLTLDMYLRQTCTLKLSIDAPLPTTGALHTYLYTNDITQSRISGLPTSYIDSLLNDELIVTIGEMLLIDKPIDRIYPQSPSKTHLSNKITVKHDNHSDVVVWNPWRDGASKISDMQNDDYMHMVCIETARISKPFEKIDSLGVSISFQ